jgi:hypothetical protein
MKASALYHPNRILVMLLSLLGTNLIMGQCVAPNLVFHSPVLISGTDGQVGAMYNFADVAPGLDAHIEITGLSGGATLFNIDDTAGVGYYDAFQPYVGAGANDTSYLDWKITFKKGGTDEDTILPCVAVTGVDVDGDNSNLKEFIEAATPGSIALDPATNLSVSFDGVRSKAISPVANIPMIDTSHREAMFQMNFVNVSALEYRNGAITTGGAQVRQTCIFFRPFFTENFIILPTSILTFDAIEKQNSVMVKWTAGSETSLEHYTLQRSTNGKTWFKIGNIAIHGSHATNEYTVNDFSDFTGTTYYRLEEVMKDGGSRFSAIVKISPSANGSAAFHHNTMFTGSIQLQSKTSDGQDYSVALYSMTGNKVFHQKYSLHGSATNVINVPSSHNAGIYLLVVNNARGERIYSAKVIKTN